MTYYLVKDGDNFDVMGCKGFKPEGAVAVVPAMFDRQDYPFLKGELVEDEVTGQMVWSVYVDDMKKGQDMAKTAKEEQKKAAEKSYQDDIAQELVTTFGTDNRDEAIGLYLTWTMMLTKPEFYSDKGLKDEVGRPLNTATKVSDYANGKITRALDYSVYMITRKEQLKDELELIG